MTILKFTEGDKQVQLQHDFFEMENHEMRRIQ
jgi:hypothetical protein